MDNTSPGLAEKRSSSGLSNGPSMRRARSPMAARPLSSEGSTGALSPTHLHHHIIIIVQKDEKGYGMKVSGDNPVFVQSVKEGGAAERAGLHSGDTIIKVNGVDVTHSTHTEVVELIKSASQVVLTVQQHPLRERSGSTAMASPNLTTRHHSLQSRDRVTAPQPVDHEKMRQLEHQRSQTLKLMLEKEHGYVEQLRSKLAKCSDPSPDRKLQEDLQGAERRVHTLQHQLQLLTNHHELEEVEAPALPVRNLPRHSPNSPPPLPPRQYLLYPASTEQQHTSPSTNHSAAGPQVHTHHRTKSSPDTLSSNMPLSEASKRLIGSESMSELTIPKKSRNDVVWDVDSPRITPPGTPPPPYGGAQQPLDDPFTPINDEVDQHAEATLGETSDSSPSKNSFLNFAVQGTVVGQVQQPIISMEDEDTLSDQDMSQLEDHGPFKSISKLLPHPAHLAVFLNYVISNSDPSSLLFYLVTDLFKEGNAKEMKKWAYEIHSSFLVPFAPLRLNNVDENVAREIDDVLLKDSDKEEILRKVFFKARSKAKEELNEQLADFQAKRTAGLGTLFGPPDNLLDESILDKGKEGKIIEQILVPTLEPYLEDMEKEVVDDRRYTTCAALGTVMAKVFGLKGPLFSALLERCPTYVSKDKSLKAKLIGKTRKVTTRGHHFLAHQYYTVTYCNHCQFIIWGIGPQGYQCSNCGFNIHRNCVKIVEENCPGPLIKKERANDRISKLMERIRPENVRRRPNHHTHADRSKRLLEEETLTDNEIGERPGGGRHEKRPDPVRESEEKGSRPTSHETDINIHDLTHHHHHHHVVKPKPNPASINRSESYKEQVPQKRQLRERRKTSDPNLSKTNNDVELDTTTTLSYNTNSGSSSNSSLSTSRLSDRSLESPSTSLEAVSGGGGVGCGPGVGGVPPTSMWDSDIEAEQDPPDWTTTLPEPILKQLSSQEKKRQEIINELFHTERSHVRGLKVLDQVFYRPMKEQQITPPELIELLFANLEEMLVIHSQFNNQMKAKRKENPVVNSISPILVSMFEGDNFQTAAATFCAKQQIALEALKEKRKKEGRLQIFLNEAEMNPVCRRLQLKDIIPTGWLRLTKYPLLLENLAKYTPKEHEDYELVKWSIDRSKEILNHVDKAVKEALDKHRLSEIQRKLDKTPFDKSDHPLAAEFKSLDLTKQKLIYEGALNWRMSNRQKLIDVHVLLLEEVIVLLQKQDEKYVLKYYNATLSPVIKVSTVLVRPNAVDKKALFLVNTSQSGAQIYDLVATSSLEKKAWFKHISDAAEAYKQREGKQRRPEPTISSHTDLETHDSVHDKTKEHDESGEGNSHEMLSPPRSSNGGGSSEQESASPNSESTPLPSAESTPQAPSAPPTPEPTTSTLGDGGLRRQLLRVTTEGALIDPCEVLISQRDVLTAEPVLTPLEKLRRKDEEIRQALLEKQTLVADILHVPRDEYQTIAELAAEPTDDKDASELVLAALEQANQLGLCVNDALQVTEEEAISATSEVSGSSPRGQRLPGVPAHRLQSIASQLNTQLSKLMILMTEKEEERERLRRELQRSREQLHALHERQSHNGPSNVEPEANPLTSAQTTSPEVFVDALSEEGENVDVPE